MIYKPLGYQQVTSLNTVKTLTVPAGAERAFFIVTGQNVRYRDDGTNPDANTGMLIKTTDPPLEYKGDLAALKFIEVTASAVLNVAYYA